MKKSTSIKRLLDLVLSGVILITLSPLLIFIVLLILVYEGRPILYTSQRMVSPEKGIKILKFRTMVRNATDPKYRLEKRFMRDGYLDIPLDCEVYTPIGRILERSQLVEVLQTLNILMKQMSFVGNRPLPVNNIELLKKFPGWEERFNSPAGITGISQIAGKYGINPQQRLCLERMYSNVYSSPNGNILLCDFLITIHTIKILLTGKYLGFDNSLALLLYCGADKDLIHGNLSI